MLRASSSVGFAILFLAGTAHAHGGRFVPPPKPATPADVVPTPPIYRGPVGRSGARPGPGRPGKTGPHTVVTGPQPRPGATVATGSTPIGADVLDLSTWDLWWEFNKEPFLRVKQHVTGTDAESGIDGFYLGYGDGGQDRLGPAPTKAEVRDVVVPALLETLADDGAANDVVTGCLIALGRSGRGLGAAQGATIEAAMRARLPSSNQEVSETAAVALGILGRGRSAPLLGALLGDEPAGREALGGRPVPVRTRAFAAYGLGLVGLRSPNEDVRRYAVHRLASALQADVRARAATPDVGVACVLALGGVRLPCDGGAADPDTEVVRGTASSREAQVLTLLDVLRNGRYDRVVRSHVPSALGALLAESRDEVDPEVFRDVVQDLMDRLRSRRESNELKQACVAALGILGDGGDDPLDASLRGLLLDADVKLSDRHARHLALIALARCAARADDAGGENQVDVRRHLLRKLARGNAEARWAAIGLGILERGLAERGSVVPPDSRNALHRALADANSPLDVGAFAIASGLLGAPEAEPLLRETLERTRSDDARGYAAVALGMLGTRGAAERIGTLLQESVYRPRLLRELAVALVLTGDRSAGTTLLAMLDDASSQASQASIARALGRVGDRSTIEPLIGHLADESRTASARAFAAAALGIVADRDELPWNTWLSVIANYAAAPPTLFDLQGFGILNIL